MNLSVGLCCPFEISICSVLKHIILPECTQSADNIFHLFPLLWGKEYFQTSNIGLLCPFTSVKSCPIVLLPG